MFQLILVQLVHQTWENFYPHLSWNSFFPWNPLCWLSTISDSLNSVFSTHDLLLLTPKCGYSLKAFSLIFFCLCLPPWQSFPDPWVIQRIHSSFSLSLQYFNLITDQYFFYFLDISAWLSGRTSTSTPKANSFSCQQNCSSFALSCRLYSLPSSLPLLSLQCYRTSEMSHTFMLCVPVLCYRILHTTFTSVSHSPAHCSSPA